MPRSEGDGEVSDKSVLEYAEGMADGLGDGTWKTWDQEQAHEVEEVLDSLRAMVRDRDDGCCISCDPRLGDANSARQFARRLVEEVRRIQAHIEAGGANEELTAATVLCSKIIAEEKYGTYMLPRSSLTPELFMPAQIAFLRGVGLRVEYLGSNQSVFNDSADKTEGHLRRLRATLAAALRPNEAPAVPAGHTPLCMAPMFGGGGSTAVDRCQNPWPCSVHGGVAR